MASFGAGVLPTSQTFTHRFFPDFPGISGGNSPILEHRHSPIRTPSHTLFSWLRADLPVVLTADFPRTSLTEMASFGASDFKAVFVVSNEFLSGDAHKAACRREMSKLGRIERRGTKKMRTKKMKDTSSTFEFRPGRQA